jgi:penicillin-binding protein 2
MKFMKMSKNALKNRHSERKLFKQRLLFIYLCIIGLALILISRLLYLQVIEHQRYTTLSKRNQLSTVPIAPTRGVIYDRNGILLAENVPAYSLEVIPEKNKNLPRTIKKLQHLIPSINQEDITNFYKLKLQYQHFDSIPLKMRLTSKEVAEFSINQYRFPGVSVRAHPIRHYTQKKTMAHVLGYVGRINTTEWTSVDQVNYSASHFIGKIGIEKYYEQLLHGTVGYEQVEMNANGRIIRTLSRTPPISGKEIYLSIDFRLQKASENALGQNRGAIIAIDPNNGEILTMVSNPSYDPNLFVTGISQKKFNELMNAPNKPLYNRAIRGQYPLASTIKPYLALAALDQKIVTPEHKIYDPGWFKLPNSSHRYRDWKKGGHGWVDISTAIISSCDVYFYNLSHLMGIKMISNFLSLFGYGKPTGIDMNEELSGLIPTPEWKMRVHHAPWYPGDTVISAIGQGYMLTTPMQLANAVATMSQRGNHFKPHLLLSYKTKKGDRIYPATKKLSPVILEETNSWDIVIDAMQQVIKNPHGTGTAFHGASYSVAGKTGTAQVFTVKQSENTHNEHLPEHLRDHALFIGFAPVEHPEIALAVVTENNHDASKIARQVMDTYLLKLHPRKTEMSE